jgi:tetratricopeptide (TPR) repeat protein
MWSWLKSLIGGKHIAPSTVLAERQSVAAGRDIRDSLVTIGLNEDEVARLVGISQRSISKSLDTLTAEIAREKGIPYASLRAIFDKLGEGQVSDEEIPSRLEKIATQLLELRAVLQSGREQVSGVRREALSLVDTGDLVGAFAALDRARLALHAVRQTTSQDEAALLADQARIEELRLSYLAAAAKYREAANLVGHHRAHEFFELIAKQATALQKQGEEFGDNEALKAAISIWKEARSFRTFEMAPDDFRKADNNLGSALYALGVRESNNEFLEEALVIGRNAFDRDRDSSTSKYRLAAYNNLGATLQALGERESGTEKHLEALSLYREALQGVDKSQDPEKWAGISLNTGNALKFVAERDKRIEMFEEAISEYKEALSVLEVLNRNFDQAMALTNMGAVLANLGQALNKAAPLEESIAVLKNALSLVVRERYPMLWGMIKNNTSVAFCSLGIVTNDIQHFREARVAAHEALTVFHRNTMPLQWAFGVWGIGTASRMIAERTQDGFDAKAAVDALTLASATIQASVDERAKPGVLQALAEARSLYDALNVTPRRD